MTNETIEATVTLYVEREYFRTAKQTMESPEDGYNVYTIRNVSATSDVFEDELYKKTKELIGQSESDREEM